MINYVCLGHVKIKEGFLRIRSTDGNFGFDAQRGEYGDMLKAGIIDPTKVVRTALQDAASIAGLLITTEAMIAEKPEKKSPPLPLTAVVWVIWISKFFGIGNKGKGGISPPSFFF